MTMRIAALWLGMLLAGCSGALSRYVVGATCDLGGGLVYVGCDGTVHTDAIVRWTRDDGDVVTCWEGQAVVEPFACASGTACIVVLSDGAQHSGVCR